MAGFAADFRRCYNVALHDDPDSRGMVRVTAKIDANGKVVETKTVVHGDLQQEVGDCVAHVVEAGQFSPPDGGGATLVIPVSFAPR